MTMKAAEKIIEALNQLMEGYVELQESVRDDLGAPATEEDATESADPELDEEIETAIATELRAVMESVLENEDYSTEEFAGLISNITQAIEEIDPDVFATEGEATEEEYEDLDDDDDYDVDDDDDDDLDDVDEDEEEETEDE